MSPANQALPPNQEGEGSENAGRNKQSGPSTPDGLIGVIWSASIQYGRGVGYALVISKESIIGARKSSWISSFEAYLGPGNKLRPDDVTKARKIAAELVDEKEFELPKESIAKITYKKPGTFSRGHFIFTTSEKEVRLDVPGLAGSGDTMSTMRKMVASLILFAPDRFFDEETGKLMSDEVLERLRRSKKHWW